MKRILLTLVAVSWAVASTGFARADDRADLQSLVDVAAAVVDKFRAGSQKADIDALLAKAHAVVIYPNILKGAFVFGAEGGTGVILSFNPKDGWSGPAFITFGAASFGLQAGVESSSVLMIATNPETVKKLATGDVELGNNATLALGEGVKGKLLSTDQLADIYYFVQVEGGAFAGINLKGGVNKPREGLNETYYGRVPTTMEEVLIDRTVKTTKAEPLINALSR